jgi:protein-S-isoprenylcysteine O-methyltransferase Ste14
MQSGGSAATIIPSPIAIDNWVQLRQSKIYDALMRLPFLSWMFFVATVTGFQLLQYLHKGAALPTIVFAINCAMQLATFIFLVLLAAAVIIRTRPTAKAHGVGPRLSALMGTFLIYAICLFPRRELSPVAGIGATLLILLGTASAAFVLKQLGRSFSIMAEARQLVTSGVYGFVRHPLYLAEELAVVGVVMPFLSYWTAPILVGQIAFQLRRMRNEEAVLAGTFPEYTAYSARTARLIPWVY